MINKYIKGFGTVAIALLYLLLSSTFASAAIVGFVAQDKNGKYYEYEYEHLLECYLSQLLGASGPVYDDFCKKNVCVFIDDKNSYIDYDDVLEAYLKALLGNKKFDANKYTASKQAKKANMPSEVYVVTKDSKGKLKYTLKVLETAAEILVRINRAGSAADLEAVVTSRASQIGLSLTAFNKLNRSGKNAALNEVLNKKPAKGFDSLDKFKQSFNSAVNAAQPALEAALKAVNNATSEALMKEALIKYDSVLGLNLSRYNLKTAEQNQLAARLLPQAQSKHFASAEELQRILHTKVIALRFNYSVNHTVYDYTMEHMLNKQMGLSDCPPQTDLYGGGWKNARREDVARYIDPYNFIDMDYCGTQAGSIRITAEPNLIVREKPTTQSKRVTGPSGEGLSVWYDEIYAILERKEAEKGTQSGTEGPWYRIEVSGKKGWICGKYCQVVGKTLELDPMFQFLLLSKNAGSTAAGLNKILAGKGILSGMGDIFMQASQIEHKGRTREINEIFLVSLALHETGNGTSELATGVEEVEVKAEDNLYPDVAGQYTREARVSVAELFVREQPTTGSKPLKDASNKDIMVRKNDVFTILEEQDAKPGTASGSEGPWYKIKVSGKVGWICGVHVQVKIYVKVYNMFGIGAFDSNPNLHGAQRAYDERWFTPEAAILGGAKFASERYVHSSDQQDTLYKMRWNPKSPATHQYATDIGWAAKQVAQIKALYDRVGAYTLTFDIPRYKE